MKENFGDEDFNNNLNIKNIKNNNNNNFSKNLNSYNNNNEKKPIQNEFTN